MPDTTQIDLKLATLRQQLTEKKAAMEAARASFLASAPAVLEGWYDEVVTHLKTEKVTEINAMPVEKLRALKGELSLQRDRVKEAVQATVAKEGYWWHLWEHSEEPLPAAPSSMMRPRTSNEAAAMYDMNDAFGFLPDVLQKGMTLAMGECGEVLKKYGFVPNTWKGNEGVPFHSASVSETVRAAVKQYATHYKAATKLLDQIRELNAERARIMAASKWDEI